MEFNELQELWGQVTPSNNKDKDVQASTPIINHHQIDNIMTTVQKTEKRNRMISLIGSISILIAAIYLLILNIDVYSTNLQAAIGLTLCLACMVSLPFVLFRLQFEYQHVDLTSMDYLQEVKTKLQKRIWWSTYGSLIYMGLIFLGLALMIGFDAYAPMTLALVYGGMIAYGAFVYFIAMWSNKKYFFKQYQIVIEALEG